jgi:hypothetical protein
VVAVEINILDSNIFFMKEGILMELHFGIKDKVNFIANYMDSGHIKLVSVTRLLRWLRKRRPD